MLHLLLKSDKVPLVAIVINSVAAVPPKPLLNKYDLSLLSLKNCGLMALERILRRFYDNQHSAHVGPLEHNLRQRCMNEDPSIMPNGNQEPGPGHGAHDFAA